MLHLTTLQSSSSPEIERRHRSQNALCGGAFDPDQLPQLRCHRPVTLLVAQVEYQLLLPRDICGLVDHEAEHLGATVGVFSDKCASNCLYRSRPVVFEASSKHRAAAGQHGLALPVHHSLNCRMRPPFEPGTVLACDDDLTIDTCSLPMAARREDVDQDAHRR